ncbi:MAG: sensor histidine kinase [Eubacteriaceae bacterium]|nr:sensor histidine kinase [Eubacteriaceae bacterium]
MAIEQKWSIFYRQIIDPNNPSQEHYAYSLVTLLILMVLYVVVNYITYILLKRILTLKIKFTGSIFVLVPVSQIALFASFLMLYYRANRLNIPSNAFGWLGCAVAIIGDVLLVITYRDLRKTDRIEATLAFLEQQQQSGFDELKNITAIEKRQQIINHDLKNQLVTATMLLSENKIEAAKESLNALSDIIKTSEKRIYCENSVVNAVINYKVTLAQKDEITINSKLFLPEDILISSMDLCSVFSNVLDNSMRAVKDYYEDADRVINLVCAASNGYLVIKSDNAAKEKLDIKGNLIATSKENPEMHGYGLMIMENIAAKYNGKMSIKQENDRFYFEMLLSLEESAADKNKGK